MTLLPLVVALDGPASSGKSSVGAAAAREVGFRFCDTGLLYRAITWLVLERGIDPADQPALVRLVPEVELAADELGRLARVLVHGEDVTDRVHAPDVDRRVSEVSRAGDLRAALLQRQRAIASGGRIVVAGRDIGTVVLPNAGLKVFLDASAEERARRRAEERNLQADGPEARAVLAELLRRDDLDRNRPIAPLRPAPDAVHIVTDGNAFEETVAEVVAAIHRAGDVPAHAPAAAGASAPPDGGGPG